MPCGRVGAIGPAWTRGEIEKPAGTRNMGTWTAAVYTEEQQRRLGVDDKGNKRAAPITAVNRVASAGYSVASTAPVTYASPTSSIGATRVNPTASFGTRVVSAPVMPAVVSPTASIGAAKVISSAPAMRQQVTAPSAAIRQQAAVAAPTPAQEKCLGTASFAGGFSATLVDKGMRTLNVTMHAMTTAGCIEKPAGTKTERIIALRAPGVGRKAAAEASKPPDLMYIKESVSIRDISTGDFLGSKMIGNSADGTCDVWDGEEIAIGLSDTSAVEPSKLKVVIERETKLFGDPAIDDAVIKGLPGAFEAADAEEERCTKKETWEAPIQ